MKKFIALVLLIVMMVACTVPYYYGHADFEDIPLPETGYMDEGLFGGFKSGDILFTSEWVSEFGGYSNGGIYPSNLHDSLTTGILNQYSSYPKPEGHFAVVHYNDYIASTEKNKAAFILPEPTVVEYVKVANSTYTYWAIKTGDDGFGSCRAYKDGDWFKVTFTGYNACGENVGSVDYYLADFRDGKSFIEESWAYVDLTSLGKCVYKICISFSGTDIGDYGLNTPTYCVIDEIDYRVYD